MLLVLSLDWLLNVQKDDDLVGFDVHDAAGDADTLGGSRRTDDQFARAQNGYKVVVARQDIKRSGGIDG